MSPAHKESLFTPVLIIAVFLLIIAAGFLPQETVGFDNNPYLSLVIIQLLIYALPALFYCRIRGRELTPKLRLRMPKPSHVLYIFHSTVFMICTVILVSMLMYRLAPADFKMSSVSEYAAFAMNQRFFDVVYLIIAAAVLPAVTEELLFRGIIIGEYQNYGAGIAAVMSALMFAMSHFSLVRLPVYFVSGLILAAVVFATRSIAAGIIIHTLNNAAVLLSEKYIVYISDRQNISLGLFVMIVAAVALLSGMLMCYEAQYIYKSYSQSNTESEYAARKSGLMTRIAGVFFSPTFLVVVVIFVIAAIFIK